MTDAMYPMYHPVMGVWGYRYGSVDPTCWRGAKVAPGWWVSILVHMIDMHWRLYRLIVLGHAYIYQVFST